MASPSTPGDLRSDYLDPARGPIRVVIEQPRASLLARALKWLFVIAIVLALFTMASWQSYYDTSGDIQERWHSLSTTAPDKVAIISVEGTIFGDEGFVKHQIDRVRDDDAVKAIVLRVDSPGGTVTGSDYIYYHLKQLAEKKQVPLVVSMGSVAASGGYYIAMAAGDRENTIYAEPTCWTGSIGVIIPHYDVSGLLEKINVADDSIASNPLKMMGSPTRKFPEPIREQEQQILKELVDSSFDDFKQIVLASRAKLRDDKAAQEVAFTGRIFTAKQAQQYHLVDRLGFVDDAIARSIELAGLDKENVRAVKYLRRMGLVDQMLFGPSSRKPPVDLRSLIDLTTPRAYYLCSWLCGIEAR